MSLTSKTEGSRRGDRGASSGHLGLCAQQVVETLRTVLPALSVYFGVTTGGGADKREELLERASWNVQVLSGGQSGTGQAEMIHLVLCHITGGYAYSISATEAVTVGINFKKRMPALKRASNASGMKKHILFCSKDTKLPSLKSATISSLKPENIHTGPMGHAPCVRCQAGRCDVATACYPPGPGSHHLESN